MMTLEDILGIVIFIVVFLAVAFLMRLYWRMRSDNGYNMGRNHMRDLGFTDDDIENGQDDEDADLYVFRRKRRRGENEESDRKHS